MNHAASTQTFPIAILPSDTIGVSTAPPPTKDSRIGSILASVIAPQAPEDPTPEDPADVSPVFDSLPPVSNCFQPPRYTAQYLQGLNHSRVGNAFHIFNSKGEMLRRGLVLEDNPHHFYVCFCDVFGLLGKKQSVRKSATTNWQWFASVEESNAAYDRHFNVTDREEEIPAPSFVWTDRSLEQIYYQEAN